MDCFQIDNHFKGPLHSWLLFFFIWLSSVHDAVSVQTRLENTRISSKSEPAKQPISGFFDPIEISPAVLPHNPHPHEPLSPAYPTFPTRYEPVLSGRCPINFTAISSLLDKTASDCSHSLAAFVGNVICCPQLNSLVHIFRGFHSVSSNQLVFQNVSANYCFKDITSILESRGANSTIPVLCSVNASNLTGGSCPVKDSVTFEKVVNTRKLLEACISVDPLKECCRPVCQPAIMEAALQLLGRQLTMNENKNVAREFIHLDSLSDCKGAVYAYISSKLPMDEANDAFRILSSCKVNKVCPLDFKQPSEVIKACRNVSAPSPSCCKSLNSYIAGTQKQIFITNLQAIICSTVFGSMLRKGGVITNVFKLCDVDLKYFSIQAYGQEGCLLRSLPTDVILDNVTGFSLTCDLSDNIAAPWPSSSSVSSISLCAPEMSLPALPTSETLRNTGCGSGGLEFLLPIFFIFCFSAFFY